MRKSKLILLQTLYNCSWPVYTCTYIYIHQNKYYDQGIKYTRQNFRNVAPRSSAAHSTAPLISISAVAITAIAEYYDSVVHDILK